MNPESGQDDRIHDHCIVAEFATQKDAQTALDVLAKRGYGEESISIVAHRDHPRLRDLPTLEEDAGGVGSSSGATAGALLGGTITTPVAASTLIGPFMLAGPLVGLGLGAAIGAFLSGDQRWGVEKNAAEELQDRVQNGAILLVMAGTEEQIDEAEGGLRTTKHESIHRFAEPAATEKS